MIQKVDVRILHLGRDYNNYKRAGFWVAREQDNNAINYNDYVSYL